MSKVRLMGLVLATFCACALAAGASAAGQTDGAIPNFSSADFPWLPTSPQYAPPASGPGPVTYDHGHPIIARQLNQFGVVEQRTMPLADLNDLNLRPWVIEYLKKTNDEQLAGMVRSTSRASCRPAGVPEFLVHGAAFRAIYFLQTPKEVVMISDADMQIRHIYMNVSHSEHLTPSYYGEWVGRYEGDELVVDTIGFNDKTLLDDRYNVPHTRQLHVIERFKLLQGGRMLEVDFTVDDPATFNRPWFGVVRYRHPRAPRPFEEEACAEEPAAGFGHNFGVPIAEKPDF